MFEDEKINNFDNPILSQSPSVQHNSRKFNRFIFFSTAEVAQQDEEILNIEGDDSYDS